MISKSKYHYTSLSILPKVSVAVRNYVLAATRRSDNLTDQGVIGVRNVSVCKNGVLKSTSTYVLTFNTPILPKKIKVAFLSVNVEVYIPNPLRLYQCQVFGHHEDYCMKKPICGNCGGERHCNDDRNCKNTAKCVNCNGNHPVFSRDCPTWKK